MDVRLYDYEASACCAKARWALAEENVNWRRSRIDVLAFDHKTAEYLARDPRGLVPTAEIDGVFQTGTHEIAILIAERLGSDRVWPLHPMAQRTVRQWLDTIDGFHMAYGVVLYEEIFLPAHRARARQDREAALARIADEKTRLWMAALIENSIPAERIQTAIQSIDEGFRAAGQALANAQWLAGDSFSLADISLYPYVDSIMHRVTELWFNRLPHLQRWLKQMRARAAYKLAITEFPWPDELRRVAIAAAGGGGYRYL